MAVYFVTGKLGSGKSLVTVGRIQDYMRKNRRVATNLDLNVQELNRKQSKASFTRLPDKPRVEDLELLGRGSDDVDESTYGLIVLDECGTWLNSRTWNDPERKAFVDWMLHARKLGWDVMFIIQHIDAVDKQVKISLCEHLVICRRLDRLRIPVISRLLKMVTGFNLTFPKIHRAKVHYGESEQDLVADVWTYRGHYLYDAYDTRQVFSHDTLSVDDKEIDMRASYTGLSRYHVEGRYLPQSNFPTPKTFFQFLLYPSWLILYCIVYAVNVPTRSVGSLSR